MLKSICQGVFVLGFSIALTACGPDFYGTAYPAVTVSDPTPPPASSSMHYGPSANPPASSSMHYGPSAPSRPAVTVTNGPDASDSMHYGND